jgi:hypothetical protein
MRTTNKLIYEYNFANKMASLFSKLIKSTDTNTQIEIAGVIVQVYFTELNKLKKEIRIIAIWSYIFLVIALIQLSYIVLYT